MITFLQFALLGLATGAIYALIAQGAVLVYRGSGLLNLARRFRHGRGLRLLLAPSTGGGPGRAEPGAGSAPVRGWGWLMHLLILRPMRQSSSLTRVVATLGIVIVLQSLAYLIYGQYSKVTVRPSRSTPSSSVEGPASDRLRRVGHHRDRVVLSMALTIVYRYTVSGG